MAIKLFEEKGPYQYEPWCDEAANSIENGNVQGDLYYGYSYGPILINGEDASTFFKSDDVKSLILRDISYPVKDGHASYRGLDEIIGTYSSLDFSDPDVQTDLIKLGFDEEEVKSLANYQGDEDEEIEAWIDYDIQIDDSNVENDEDDEVEDGEFYNDNYIASEVEESIKVPNGMKYGTETLPDRFEVRKRKDSPYYVVDTHTNKIIASGFDWKEEAEDAAYRANRELEYDEVEESYPFKKNPVCKDKHVGGDDPTDDGSNGEAVSESLGKVLVNVFSPKVGGWHSMLVKSVEEAKKWVKDLELDLSEDYFEIHTGDNITEVDGLVAWGGKGGFWDNVVSGKFDDAPFNKNKSEREKIRDEKIRQAALKKEVKNGTLDEGWKDNLKKAGAMAAVAGGLLASNPANGMDYDPYYDGATRPFEDSIEQVSDYEAPKLKEIRKDGTYVDQYGNEFTKDQWEALLRGEDPFDDHDDITKTMSESYQLNEGTANFMMFEDSPNLAFDDEEIESGNLYNELKSVVHLPSYAQEYNRNFPAFLVDSLCNTDFACLVGRQGYYEGFNIGIVRNTDFEEWAYNNYDEVDGMYYEYGSEKAITPEKLKAEFEQKVEAEAQKGIEELKKIHEMWGGMFIEVAYRASNGETGYKQVNESEEPENKEETSVHNNTTSEELPTTESPVLDKAEADFEDIKIRDTAWEELDLSGVMKAIEAEDEKATLAGNTAEESNVSLRTSTAKSVEAEMIPSENKEQSKSEEPEVDKTDQKDRIDGAEKTKAEIHEGFKFKFINEADNDGDVISFEMTNGDGLPCEVKVNNKSSGQFTADELKKVIERENPSIWFNDAEAKYWFMDFSFEKGGKTYWMSSDDIAGDMSKYELSIYDGNDYGNNDKKLNEAKESMSLSDFKKKMKEKGYNVRSKSVSFQGLGYGNGLDVKVYDGSTLINGGDGMSPEHFSKYKDVFDILSNYKIVNEAQITGENSPSGIDFLKTLDEKGRYMFLSRMQQDCGYFLDGHEYNKFLWAGNVEDQIKYMKWLYNSFPKNKKPEWISMEEIEDYEKRMAGKGKEDHSRDEIYEEKEFPGLGLYKEFNDMPASFWKHEFETASKSKRFDREWVEYCRHKYEEAVKKEKSGKLDESMDSDIETGSTVLLKDGRKVEIIGRAYGSGGIQCGYKVFDENTNTDGDPEEIMFDDIKRVIQEPILDESSRLFELSSKMVLREADESSVAKVKINSVIFNGKEGSQDDKNWVEGKEYSFEEFQKLVYEYDYAFWNQADRGGYDKLWYIANITLDYNGNKEDTTYEGRLDLGDGKYGTQHVSVIYQIKNGIAYDLGIDEGQVEVLNKDVPYDSEAYASKYGNFEDNLDKFIADKSAQIKTPKYSKDKDNMKPEDVEVGDFFIDGDTGRFYRVTRRTKASVWVEKVKSKTVSTPYKNRGELDYQTNAYPTDEVDTDTSGYNRIDTNKPLRLNDYGSYVLASQGRHYLSFWGGKELSESFKGNTKALVEDEVVVQENPLKEGDILCSSWGYSMKLVDFYKVLSSSKSFVKLAHLADYNSKQDEYGQAGYKMPKVDQVEPDSNVDGRRFKVHFTDENEPYVSINNYERAYVWNGKPQSFDTYD